MSSPVDPAQGQQQSSTKQKEQPKPARSARGRPTDDPDVRHSKTLSYILRHGAAKEGLTLRPDGFVKVSDLLKRPKLKGCDMDTLERIVRDNAKQRFTMRAEPTGPDGADELWIRANQGHSVQVDSLDLQQVQSADEIPVMVHGTSFKLWPQISQEGIKVMGRNHVHCATGLFGDDNVKSGENASKLRPVRVPRRPFDAGR
ncbi:tRNA 2'-phosphotransferase [Microbotryomycetes sp. JL201]|nr:tRNA 2'-phosphotransferase [Microbotryomycetes sp. JL201]